MSGSILNKVHFGNGEIQFSGKSMESGDKCWIQTLVPAVTSTCNLSSLSQFLQVQEIVKWQDCWKLMLTRIVLDTEKVLKKCLLFFLSVGSQPRLCSLKMLYNWCHIDPFLTQQTQPTLGYIRIWIILRINLLSGGKHHENRNERYWIMEWKDKGLIKTDELGRG